MGFLPEMGNGPMGCQRTPALELAGIATCCYRRLLAAIGGYRRLEAAPGFEPGITVLQTVALATWLCRPKYLRNNYLYRRGELNSSGITVC